MDGTAANGAGGQGGGAGTGTGAGNAMHYPNPNVQNNPHVYMAVYSSVPVYEMMVRGIGVMRRRSDSYMNATQILKVAGVDKAKRTKILDKEIVQGEHEKVQGGYGRYQGTWIPFWRAQELAGRFGVTQLLSPLFDYVAAPTPAGGALGSAPGPSVVSPDLNRPNNQQAAASRPAGAATQPNGGPSAAGAQPVAKRDREEDFDAQVKRARMDIEGPEASGRLANGIAHASGGGPNGIVPTGSHFNQKLRRASRPIKPTHNINDDPLKIEKQKHILMSVFVYYDPNRDDAAAQQQPPPDLANLFGTDVDVDLPIDDVQHTALHWATALGRVQLAKEFVKLGADPARGNSQGETPLIRSVMVTNSYDQNAFPDLLGLLGPTLRVIDDSGRTILHHITLIASLKGRAGSARYYMENVLEYIARHEGGEFRELVDAQDTHGDTALNIAARVGNRSLVRMLVEVGADKGKPNKLGLRPGDFGVTGEDLSTTAGEEVVSAIRQPAGTSAPLRKSRDVVSSLTTLIDSLASDFSAEIKTKSEALERTREQLRAATRQLAEQRKQINAWRGKVAETDEVKQKVKNLERALVEEDTFDWTGRTEVDGSPARPEAGGAFTYRGPGSTLAGLPAVHIQLNLDADPPIPQVDNTGSNVHLRRMESWYERVLSLLRQRVESIEGASVEQERRCRQIVSAFCGVEVEKVDGMLDQLLVAMESDGPSLDLGRVAGFMNKVNAGQI